MTDEEFVKEYRPLQVPSHYDPADRQERKIIYALAKLGEGTVTDVVGELMKLEPGVMNAEVVAQVKAVLTGLFDKGLLAGHQSKLVMKYNLHKVTEANDGLTATR